MNNMTVLEWWSQDYEQSSLFEELASLGAPWAPEEDSEIEAQAADLETEYFFNRSGSKFVSPVIRRITEVYGEATMGNVASLLMTRFKEPWKRLWDVEVIEYSPINNYDMLETYGELSREHGYDTENKGGNEASQTDTNYGKTATTSHGLTNAMDEYTYGINNVDTDGKHSSRVSEAQGGSTSTTDSGTDTVGVGSNWTENSSLQRDMSNDKNYTLQRKGNIGVTTSQQMVMAERETRKWNYFTKIFEDIDSVLTIPIYDPCRIEDNILQE